MKCSKKTHKTILQELGRDSIQFLKGKETKEPFVSYKSFHIFSRFSSSAVFGDTSFFSNSQKLHALFPTLSTLPEKLNYITIHPSVDSIGQHHNITENQYKTTIHYIHTPQKDTFQEENEKPLGE